jgi:hypothetical protein
VDVEEVRGGRRGEDERPVDASARAGFAARAVLYVLVGVLAARLALGGAGEEASQQGAMSTLAAGPFGRVLLSTLAAGLVAYALYRVWQAVRGRGEGGVLRRRVVPGVRACVYTVLALLAVQELLGSGERTSESSVTGAVLDLPFGQLLVAGGGLAVVGVGVEQLVKVWRGDVHELARPAQLPAHVRRWAGAVGRLGHLGRAAVFTLTGAFLVRAAVTHDPDEGVGLDAALGEVVQAPFGTPLLLAVAAGLVLFGVHCALEARYGHAADAS